MFKKQMKVRMYDTDAAGILFFGNQFRLINDVFEDWLLEKGYGFDHLFGEFPFGIVVAHAESDYIKPLRVGDILDISMTVDSIGESSFTLQYDLFKADVLVGKSKMTHVVIDRKTGQSCSIPEDVKTNLFA